MGIVAAGATGARPSSPSGAGPAPAAEPLSLFGINLARVALIPLRRWKVTLALLVLCAAGGYLYAKRYAKASYESVGTLIYRAPPEQRDIPAPKNLDTHVEELKNLH